MDMTLDRVVIARPGGNDTALVFDFIPRSEQGELSKLIQKNYPGVEQVMFVENAQNNLYGQMAGGEFCGNATRSLAAVLTQDGILKPDEPSLLTVSGSSQPLQVRVTNTEAMAQMPVQPNSVTITTADPGVTLVELEGISFIVLEPDSALYSTMKTLRTVDERKACAMGMIGAYGLKDKPAAGVLVITERGDRLVMDPYVYVSATGTIYFETACGSGTTAIGLLTAKRRGQSVTNYAVYQPSGMPINVSVAYQDDQFQQAFISGPVSITFDGPLLLNMDDVTRPPVKLVEKAEAA